MKKLLLISALAVSAMSVSAARYDIQLEDWNQPVVQSTMQVVNEPITVETVAPKAGAQLKSGDSYYLVYDSFTNYVDNTGTNKANGTCTISLMGNDSIKMEGVIMGYDLIGTYDAAQGIISVTFPQEVGTHSTLGPITARMIKESSLYNGTYKIAVGSDGNLTFNQEYGFYGSVEAGAVARMEKIQSYIPNGKTNLTFNTNSGTIKASNCLTASYTDGKLTIEGLNVNFQGSYIPFVFNVNKEAKTLEVPAKTVFDRYVASNVKREYYIIPFSADGQYVEPDSPCKLTYTTTDKSTEITFANPGGKQFVGYSSNGTNWSGFQPFPWTITLDFVLGEEAPKNDTIVSKGLKYVLMDNNQASCIGYEGTLERLNIPAQISYNNVNYDVVSIGNKAFEGCKALTSAILPESITSIGTRAFMSCTSLTTINLSDSIESLGDAVFNGCTVLEMVHIPKKLTTLPASTFRRCNKITEIILPDNIKTLGNYVFQEMENLEHVDLGKVETVGSDIFSSDKKITEVKIPETLTNLGYMMFVRCSNLRKAVVPPTIKKYGGYEFYRCDSLSDVTLPDNLPCITQGMFSYVYGITSMVLPESVKSLEQAAFAGCKNLTEIDLPAGLTAVANQSLKGCVALKKIICRAAEPPVVDNGKTEYTPAFLNVPKDAIVYVPDNSIAAYKADEEGWAYFSDFRPLSELSGIESVEADETGVVEYYNLQGMKVNSNNVNSGIYIVRQGNKTTKVVVK